MLYEEIRTAVCETARKMSRDGLVRLTSGNVSARIPGTDLFCITPSGMDYATLTPEDITVCRLDGTNNIEGKRRPSTETPMHRMTYNRRPDVNAVVHTHSPYASAFAINGMDLPIACTELAALAGGDIKCAPYAKATTEEFAETALATLGDEGIGVLLQNHGVMVTGPDLGMAYAIAIAVEEAAQIYVLAKSIGQPIHMPIAEQKRMFAEFRAGYGQPKSL